MKVQEKSINIEVKGVKGVNREHKGNTRSEVNVAVEGRSLNQILQGSKIILPGSAWQKPNHIPNVARCLTCKTCKTNECATCKTCSTCKTCKTAPILV